MDYLTLKLLHILASVFLFGTGVGITFYLHVANRSGDADVIRLMAANAIGADLLFTLPGYVIVASSGVLMFHQLQLVHGSLWFVAVCALFLLFTVLWIRGLLKVWRLRPLIRNAKTGAPLATGVSSTISQRCHGDIAAFIALFLVFVLMTFKPWYGVCLLGCN
jgi:uncharacterized membrane protein